MHHYVQLIPMTLKWDWVYIMCIIAFLKWLDYYAQNWAVIMLKLPSGLLKLTHLLRVKMLFFFLFGCQQLRNYIPLLEVGPLFFFFFPPCQPKRSPCAWKWGSSFFVIFAFRIPSYRKTLSRGAYGHDPFWSVFEEYPLDSTRSDSTMTLSII